MPVSARTKARNEAVRLRDANYRMQHEKQQVVLKAKDCPCKDCGIKYPSCAMDFDHRDPAAKSCNLAQAHQRMGWSKLVEEIGKCDVVCSNCHRVRTWEGVVNYPVEILLWQC